MRLSIDTLILLARLGDADAEQCAIWLDQHRAAQAWTGNGRIGAGWPGIPFGNGARSDLLADLPVTMPHEGKPA